MVHNPQDYKGTLKPTWCPGCGDFGVLTSLFQAFARLNLDPNNVAIVSGIGCSSRLPGFASTYGIHGLHGRALPLGQGVKLANPNLEVIVTGGDGDAFAIGGGHFPHVARRNIDLTYIVMDNRIYGLTKGQVAPTSSLDFRTISSPYGNFEAPVKPAVWALASGATFVARGFAGKAGELAEVLMKAIVHKGFAFVDVLSPCITFNRVDTFKYFQERVVPLPEGYQPNDRIHALQLIEQEEDHLHLGILYQESRPTYHDWLKKLEVIAGHSTPQELVLLQR